MKFTPSTNDLALVLGSTKSWANVHSLWIDELEDQLWFVDQDQGLFVWSAAFEMAVYFYAALSMLAYMLQDDEVTTDELFAIPAVFTLLAWSFAYLYIVVQALDPHGFGAPGDPDRSWMELLFLSFTVLSSTGLSDIVPVSGHARSVVMLEQVSGVFYVALVVTRLVALRGQRREPRTRTAGATRAPDDAQP